MVSGAGNWLTASFVMDDQLRRTAAKQSSGSDQVGIAMCVVCGCLVPAILLIWMFLAEWGPGRFGPTARMFVLSSFLWSPGIAVALCFIIQRESARNREQICRLHPVLGASGAWRVATDLKLLVITTERGTMGWELPKVRFAGEFPLLVHLQPDLCIAVPVNRQITDLKFDPELETLFRAAQSPAEGIHALRKAEVQSKGPKSNIAPAALAAPRVALAESHPERSRMPTGEPEVITATFDFDERNQKTSATLLRPSQVKKWRYVLWPVVALMAVVITANIEPYIHELWLVAIVSLFLSPVACVVWAGADRWRAVQRNFELQMKHPVVGAMGRWLLRITPDDIALTTPGGSATWPTAQTRLTLPRNKPIFLGLEPDLIVALPEQADYDNQPYLEMGQLLSRWVQREWTE